MAIILHALWKAVPLKIQNIYSYVYRIHSKNLVSEDRILTCKMLLYVWSNFWSKTKHNKTWSLVNSRILSFSKAKQTCFLKKMLPNIGSPKYVPRNIFRAVSYPQLLENSQLALMDVWRGWNEIFTLWAIIHTDRFLVEMFHNYAFKEYISVKNWNCGYWYRQKHISNDHTYKTDTGQHFH